MNATNRRADVAGLKAGVSLARLIGESLSLKRNSNLLVGLCPFHGEKTPSFTVYADHFHCFGCGAHGDAIGWLMQAHGMTFQEAVAQLNGGAVSRRQPLVGVPAPAAVDDDEDQRAKLELARRIWCDASDPCGTPVDAYLQHRGVGLPDAPVIRFHPRCPRRDGPLPAMVSLMIEPATGQPCGTHRTFLRPDGSGKAPVARPKKMLGNAGIVRLVAAEWIGVGLGIAEGVETSLTVTQRIGWGPVWAATSAGGIRTFPVWRASTLNIFADHDAAGLEAAEACASRWRASGQEVVIHTPPEGEDWADAAKRLVTP